MKTSDCKKDFFFSFSSDDFIGEKENFYYPPKQFRITCLKDLIGSKSDPPFFLSWCDICPVVAKIPSGTGKKKKKKKCIWNWQWYFHEKFQYEESAYFICLATVLASLVCHKKILLSTHIS